MRARLVIATTIALATVLAGATPALAQGDQSSTRPPRVHANFSRAAAVSFTPLGDSETSGRKPSLEAGIAAGSSWVASAVQGGPRLQGGWAKGGATSGAIAHASQLWAPTVAVIEVGTNDLRLHVPLSHTKRNLESMIATVGAHRVLLVAIPPRDDSPTAVTGFNRWLRAFAANNGYAFTDPWGGLRVGEHWIPSFTLDGVHATDAGYKIEGTLLAAAILKTARG